MSETFLNGRVTLHCGDCLGVLATLPENSVDACVTDPPYHLTSIVKRFGSNGSAPAQYGKDGAYARASAGFMGKQWDGGDIAFRPELWAQVLRVLKPGGHLLAFGGTRTQHRMACAIEDAGFEVRDCIQWIYGSGFPKSHDVSKGIDKAAGAEPEVVGKRESEGGRSGSTSSVGQALIDYGKQIDITAPATPEAAQWEGWGTALKPATEIICLARKPLSETTVAANVLKWGTGAINVDGCRVGINDGDNLVRVNNDCATWGTYGSGPNNSQKAQALGRWPANVIHDGSEEVAAAFPESNATTGPFYRKATLGVESTVNIASRKDELASISFGDSGSAARFFYTAKADADDRVASKHPTVKPVDLMQYLVRLITPPNGLVLDPFAGTGTTGEAAFREGMRAVLIEREAEYQADIRRRMALVLAGPDEKMCAMMKEKLKDKPVDHGPLFEVPINGNIVDAATVEDVSPTFYRAPIEQPEFDFG